MSSLMPLPAISHDRHIASLNDAYMYLLLATLAGYAVIGKGFALLGVPPLFMGEIALVLGLLVLLRTGCWIAILTSLPSLMLLALMLWVISRTIPYIGIYGMDAPRDSVLVIYGLFAFIVIALILENSARLTEILRVYGHFAWWFGLCGGGLFLLTAFGDMLPRWPSGPTLVAVRPGEVAVHLAGAAAFVLIGLRRYTIPWLLLLLVSTAMVTPSRGAMLAFVLPVSIAVVASGRLKYFLPVIFLGAALFVIAYMLGLSITIGNRSIGPEQMMHNIASIFGTSSVSNLDNTKMWRLRWWQTIQDYTFHGSYFWTGKGFGINLAESDGFLGSEDPPIRSPHNAHFTFLARTGVPGLTLWLLTLGAWYWTLVANMLRARRNGDMLWFNVLLWITCYVTAIIIHSSFDVALEGPMVGIWFWSLFGFGIASVMAYRAQSSDVKLSLHHWS